MEEQGNSTLERLVGERPKLTHPKVTHWRSAQITQIMHELDYL